MWSYFTINAGSSYSNLGCIDLSSELSKILKTDIKAYHGQLNSKDKEVIQDQFINNKFKLLIATKAFGMGINKKDIKYTIHYSMPQSVEAFIKKQGVRDVMRIKQKNLTVIYYLIGKIVRIIF